MTLPTCLSISMTLFSKGMSIWSFLQKWMEAFLPKCGFHLVVCLYSQLSSAHPDLIVTIFKHNKMDVLNTIPYKDRNYGIKRPSSKLSCIKCFNSGEKYSYKKALKSNSQCHSSPSAHVPPLKHLDFKVQISRVGQSCNKNRLKAL